MGIIKKFNDLFKKKEIYKSDIDDINDYFSEFLDELFLNYDLSRDDIKYSIKSETALMDKMYDNQEYDGMSIEDRMKMAESCGLSLRKLIHTYTGLDTHKIEEFL